MNTALTVLSHVDRNTLDRYAHTAATFIGTAHGAGCNRGFGSLIFDHDQAYRRVRRTRYASRYADRFRCLVAVMSLVAKLDATGTFVPSGTVVYLEMARLLFGEATAVGAYYLIARTIAVACCKVLSLPTDHYFDDFIGICKLPDWLTVFRLHQNGRAK